jgi:hypothetical protein
MTVTLKEVRAMLSFLFFLVDVTSSFPLRARSYLYKSTHLNKSRARRRHDEQTLCCCCCCCCCWCRWPIGSEHMDTAYTSANWISSSYRHSRTTAKRERTNKEKEFVLCWSMHTHRSKPTREEEEEEKRHIWQICTSTCSPRLRIVLGIRRTGTAANNDGESRSKQW